MDNTERSRRTRAAVIAAAQAILASDGPSRLTLDAIVKQSGVSKGGLMHQFGSKEAVLKAVLEQQIESSRQQFERVLSELDPATRNRNLRAQLVSMRDALDTSTGLISAMLAAMAGDPALLDVSNVNQREVVDAIAGESDDPDLAILRWTAARGLIVTRLIGMCPFSDEQREHLLGRIADDRFWSGRTSG